MITIRTITIIAIIFAIISGALDVFIISKLLYGKIINYFILLTFIPGSFVLMVAADTDSGISMELAIYIALILFIIFSSIAYRVIMFEPFIKSYFSNMLKMKDNYITGLYTTGPIEKMAYEYNSNLMKWMSRFIFIIFPGYDVGNFLFKSIIIYTTCTCCKKDIRIIIQRNHIRVMFSGSMCPRLALLIDLRSGRFKYW